MFLVTHASSLESDFFPTFFEAQKSYEKEILTTGNDCDIFQIWRVEEADSDAEYYSVSLHIKSTDEEIAHELWLTNWSAVKAMKTKIRERFIPRADYYFKIWAIRQVGVKINIIYEEPLDRA